MKNNQEFETGNAGGVYFEVSYLDTDCGRVRSEVFDDAAEAERFASRRLTEEDGWAIIDPVPLRRGRAAA